MGYGTEGSGTRGLLASVASVAPSKLCERERAQYGVASVASTRPKAEKDECARAHSNNSERSERQIRPGGANFFFTNKDPEPFGSGSACWL